MKVKIKMSQNEKMAIFIFGIVLMPWWISAIVDLFFGDIQVSLSQFLFYMVFYMMAIFWVQLKWKIK